MTVTTTPRLGLTRWGSDSDGFQREEFTANVDALDAAAARVDAGTAALRPAAAQIPLRLYTATDTGRLSFTDGITWRSVATLDLASTWAAAQTFSAGLTTTTATVTGAATLAAIIAADGIVEVTGGLALTSTLTVDGLITATGGIAFTPTGTIAASTVAGALAELDTEKATVVALTAHLDDTVDAHDATAISNAPAGGIAATTVQAAIDELDTEKAPKASPTFTGTTTVDNLTATGNLNLGNASTDLIGFYGATPVARPGVYNLTGSVDRTLGAYASDPESSAYTGTPADPAATAKLDDLNALRAAYENLRVYVEDLAGIVIGTATDLKTLGLIG